RAPRRQAPRRRAARWRQRLPGGGLRRGLPGPPAARRPVDDRPRGRRRRRGWRLAGHRGRPAAAPDAPRRRHLPHHGRPLRVVPHSAGGGPRGRRRTGPRPAAAAPGPDRGKGATVAYTRKNVTALTRSEKRRFVDALLAVKRRGEYDEFVRMHIDYYTADGERGLRAAHMTPSFLPWHRRFL